MSIQSEITRITQDRNTIRTKLHALGLAETSDDLDTLATAVNGIADKGTPDAEVKEGESYTIEAGYYKGGTVRGVAGGGHYELQTKTGITPTKQAQSITPDTGYYGLASVGIDPIPNNYQDVSAVTAVAGDVLANKNIVTSNGTLVAGTMPNNGAITRTLDTETTSVTIPSGYHNGSGTVSITTETKTATPTESSQNITPTSGKVLSKVVVEAIPDNYGDVTNADAVAGNILAGKKAVLNVDGDAELVTGSMTNNGAISGTIDGLTVTSYIVPSGYTSGGTVSLTNDIETALAAI